MIEKNKRKEVEISNMLITSVHAPYDLNIIKEFLLPCELENGFKERII